MTSFNRSMPKLHGRIPGSTISTLLHDRINPKDCQVLSLGDTGFLQFFRVVSRDYGKPRIPTASVEVKHSACFFLFIGIFPLSHELQRH